jgi:poly(3-hydroxybutyrate) depolymerase
MLSLVALSSFVGGCAVTQPQNTPVSQVRESDPVTGRGYWLYVPSTYRSARPAPLIVTCHGTPPYDVAEHHIREWKMLAEKNGCIVVAPELIATDGLLGDGPVVGMQADERYIMSLISYLGYRYNIDRANIMITGFSGGGFPTYWVGLRHPEIFSVIAARSCNFNRPNVEGWFTEGINSQRILVYVGQHDPGTIRSQSDRAVQFLRAKGFSVQTHEIPGAGHERHPQIAMDFFRRNWRTPVASMRTD